MIKFRCPGCQKKIGVPADFAGKRVKCPGCSGPVRVPEPQPQPAGEPVIELEDAPQADTVWTDDVLSSSLSAAGKPASSRPKIKCAKCGTVIRADSEYCPMCGNIPQGEPQESQGEQEPADTEKSSGFWRDLTRLLSPIHSASDGITFFFVLFVSVWASLPIPSCFWIAARVMLSGYICAFLFGVLLDTANGEEDLSMPSVSSMWDDFIRPFLLFLASALYAGWPFIVVFAFAVAAQIKSGGEESNPSLGILLIVLFGIGVFFWPMIILNMALGDSFFVRPDKLVISIGRAFVPYLICCLCLFVTAFLWQLSLSATSSEGIMGLVMRALAVQIGTLCIEIYAMRVMGLLYRHYGDRLDW